MGADVHQDELVIHGLDPDIDVIELLRLALDMKVNAADVAVPLDPADDADLHELEGYHFAGPIVLELEGAAPFFDLRGDDFLDLGLGVSPGELLGRYGRSAHADDDPQQSP